MVGPNKVIGNIAIPFVCSDRNTLKNVLCTRISHRSIIIVQDDATNGMDGRVIRQHQSGSGWTVCVEISVGQLVCLCLPFDRSLAALMMLEVLMCSKEVTDVLRHCNVVFVVSTCSSGT